MEAVKGDQRGLEQQRLPNGVTVELRVDGDPASADIAVCSTDAEGAPGPLNTAVLAAVGLDANDLAERFKPPATVLSGGRVPVLVVQTVGGSSTGQASLRQNLRIGLERLRGSDAVRFETYENRTMYLPLLGTGAGRLSFLESAETAMAVLATWSHPVVHRVWLSAPDAKVAAAIAASWRAKDDVPDGPPIRAAAMEPYVIRALAVAQGLTANSVIRPADVVRAVVGLNHFGQSESPAFSQIRRMIGTLPKDGLDDAWARTRGQLSSSPLLQSDFERHIRYALTASRPGVQNGHIWGRDLITAALFAGGEELDAMLATADRDLSTIIDEWYGYLTEHLQGRSRDEWDAWWRFAGVPRPGEGVPDKNELQPAPAPLASASVDDGPSRAGYFADTDCGEDYLGVSHEAEALARLMLDEHVEPPLSIGLLGDWGSGKSFFIERLKNEVDKCKGDPGLCREVVQIEFNAWHVSDGNLWASLVTHIFEEVWKHAIPPGSDSPEARAQLAQEISKAEGAMHEADAAAQKAQAAVELAEKRRAKSLVTLSVVNVVGDKLATELNKVAKEAGWERPVENLVEAQAAAKALANAGEKLQRLLSLAVGQPVHRFVVPLIIGAAVAATAWWGLERSSLASGTRELFQRGVAVAGTVGSLLAAVMIPLRRAKCLIDRFAEKLADAQKAPPEKRPEVDAARRDLATSEASLAAARTYLADLRNRDALLDPAKRLGNFLEERVQSTQYRAQQGIISLVHRDFKQLSDFMTAWRREQDKDRRANPAKESPLIRPIDRIVLYIDDLDRCRPDHVVAALEAVHLLLALDLFVVVVAVDSRWLIRALEVQYKEMLSSEGVDGRAARRSTAYDYLEKIFQLTYALAPMDPNKFHGYVDALTGRGDDLTPTDVLAPAQPADPPGTTWRSGHEAAPDIAPAIDAGRVSPKVSATAATNASAEAATARPAIAQAAQDRAKRVASPPLRFDEHEREVLKALVAVLPTPRMAKRLINVYRLIKASRPGAVAGKARQKATLFLLATLYGHPGLGAQLLRLLFERTSPFDLAESKLATAIAQHAAKRTEPPRAGNGEVSRERAEWEGFARQVEKMRLELTIEDCAGVPQLVAPYSFVTGHEWHTWTTDREQARQPSAS